MLLMIIVIINDKVSDRMRTRMNDMREKGHRGRIILKLTGIALRLEESRDGRCPPARRGNYLSSGAVQGGSGGGVVPGNSPDGFEKGAFRLRHPHQIEMLKSLA